VFYRPCSLLATSSVSSGRSALQWSQCYSRRCFRRFCRLNIFVGFLGVVFLSSSLLSAREATAGFASGFSLGVGEEYNDNIFFSNDKKNGNQSDFITHVVPTFTLFYAPPSEIVPTFTASLSPEAQIFAHNGDLSNFGDNVSFNTGYTYRYSPRLTLHAADSLRHGGVARTRDLGALGSPPSLPSTPTEFPSSGGFVPFSISQDIATLVSKGKSFANSSSLDGAFLAAPNVTISGTYGTGYISSSEGNSETTHSASISAIYKWREQHNLFANYAVTFLNSRNGNGGGKKSGGGNSTCGGNVIHSISLGDDYFSNFKIQLDPTLTLSGSSGAGLNVGSNCLSIVNNTSLTLIKIWETAVFNAAFRRGLTPSYGVSSGPSLTTSFSGGFNIRLTERLSGSVAADYSFFDTQDGNLKVLRVSAGLQYWITSWLSSSLSYGHGWQDAGSGSGFTNLASSGKVNINSILLAFSAHFDVWPNVGLSRAPVRPLYTPLGAPPFAAPETPQPVTPQPVTPQTPVSP
jgi:hypothetical protein